MTDTRKSIHTQMNQNRAFWKAFNSFTHPLSIGAVSLVLLNDHLFRIYAPSWWTGKLGDFTWLIFAPLICALIFAWLIPRRLPNHVEWVGRTSFGFIGIWFALAKTVPAVQHATNTTLSAIIGWQTSLRLDPTDLLTLPALYIGWRIWQHAPDTAPNLRPYGWLVIGVGIFATLATSPGYDYLDSGILCTYIETKNVYAWGEAPMSGFVSSDGGLSWGEVDKNSLMRPQTECQRNPRPITWQLNAGSLLFSFTDRTSIDVSMDNGETWQQEWDFSFLTDERRGLYFEHFDSTFTGTYIVGPFDAVFDEESQHLIVAMGHDGVLVRDDGGNWQWVTVGEYRYQPDVFADFDSRMALLSDKLWVACVLFLVAVASISAPYRTVTDWRLYIFPVIYWVVWISANYFIISPNSLLSFTKLLIIPLAIVSWFSLFQIANQFYKYAEVYYDNTTRIFALVAGFSLCTACLYLLPHLLWLNGTIPQFHFAWQSSIILAIASVYVFGAGVRRRYFEHFKKQPPEQIDGGTALEDLFDPE